MKIEEQTETKVTGFTITLSPEEAQELRRELGELPFYGSDRWSHKLFRALAEKVK